MTRILFYLPTVTPWWFDNVVGHMVRALAETAEVHVLVPPLWRNTGIGPEQLVSCSSCPQVNWHVADGEAHPSLRTAPADQEEIVEFARTLAPDYVFCRSADVATPARFPGKVRHLMEAGAPPFSTRAGWIILQEDFWRHGSLPKMNESDRQAVEETFASIWKRARNRAQHKAHMREHRTQALRNMGLPDDRKIVALPLEYEHEEAFTGFHNRFERNIDLISHVAEHLDDDILLAITDHPLNYRYVDNRKVYEAIDALGPRAYLVPNPEAYYFRTDLLIKHSDGLIVQNTKAIYSGVFFGKPILRLSNRSTAEWIGVHEDAAGFNAATLGGHDGATEEQARLWFGTHLLHEIINPAEMTGAEILDRVDRPFSRDRLAPGLERLEAHQRQLDLAA
jgi:hypothetical protein